MKAQFAVVRFVEGWRILFEGQKRGRFDFQIDAVEAALRLAGDVRRTGRDVEVWAQEQFGQLMLVETGKGVSRRAA